jgi:hypothetical protein
MKFLLSTKGMVAVRCGLKSSRRGLWSCKPFPPHLPDHSRRGSKVASGHRQGLRTRMATSQLGPAQAEPAKSSSRLWRGRSSSSRQTSHKKQLGSSEQQTRSRTRRLASPDLKHSTDDTRLYKEPLHQFFLAQLALKFNIHSFRINSKKGECKNSEVVDVV